MDRRLTLTALALLLLSGLAAAAQPTFDGALLTSKGGAGTNASWFFPSCAGSTPGICGSSWDSGSTMGDGIGGAGFSQMWQATDGAKPYNFTFNFSTNWGNQLVAITNRFSLFSLAVNNARDIKGLTIWGSNDSIVWKTIYNNASEFLETVATNQTVNFSGVFLVRQLKVFVNDTGNGVNAPAINEFAFDAYNVSLITLYNPQNISYITNNVTGNWSVSTSSNGMTCNSYLDGASFNTTAASSNTNYSDSINNLANGQHSYNVTCINGTDTASVIQYFSINVPVVSQPLIYYPTNTTYYGSVIPTLNFTPVSSNSSTLNCTYYNGGLPISSQVLTVGLNATMTLAGLATGLNSANVTCVNGSFSNSSIVYYYGFFGLNLTVQNGANNTVINGWTAAASNGTFTNTSSGTQNSPYNWEINFTGLSNLNPVFVNVSYTRYATSNYSFTITNGTFNSSTLSIWPLQYFYVNDLQTGKTIGSFSLSITNGSQSTSCITTNGQCAVSLQNIGIGTNTVTVIANGYSSANFTSTFTTNSMLNITYNVTQANLTLFAFDQASSLALIFNVSITNGTATASFTNLSNNNATFTAAQVPTGQITLTFNNFTGGYKPASFTVTYNNNSMVNVTAYLLANSVATQVGFRVVNLQQVALPGAIVSAGFFSGGSFVSIGNATAGSDGVASFWMNPTTQYQVNATYGTASNLNNLFTPSSNLYTLTINTVNTSVQNSVFNLSTFSLTPSRGLYAQAEIINWTANSFYGQMAWWSLVVTYPNGTVIFSQNLSNNILGGNISVTVNATAYAAQNISVINVTGSYAIQGYPPVQYYYAYQIISYTGYPTVVDILKGFSANASPYTTTIAAYLIALFAAAWVTSMSSSAAGGWAAIFIISGFAYVGWINGAIYIITLVIGAGVLLLNKGLIR